MNSSRTWHPMVLVGAPVIALAARLLVTPWYQNDDDTPDNVRVIAEMAENPLRNDLGAVLTLLSGLLYAAAAVVVWLAVRDRMPRVSAAGMLLGLTGGVGLAVFSDQVVIIGQAARLEEHRGAMVALLDESYSAPQSGISYLLLILGALGWVLLATCLYRTRTVPRAVAVVAGLGGAGVMLTAPGPAVAFIAGSAVISLVGLVAVAAALARRPESPRPAPRISSRDVVQARRTNE
jgi:hypothetical protein